ncbi:MAG: hypothetical protein KatS3mg013_1978 [Actinomycetota bacterium]|nr:MAG: hypothetical protein KatS3mg013_1978 [Actinomycetota bacterium]
MGTVNELLSDEALAARMRAEAKVIQEDPGRVKGADLLERLATTKEPVTT